MTTLKAAALAYNLPVDPREFPALLLESHASPASVIEARILNPTASALVLIRLPSRVHSGQPLEIELAVADPGIALADAVAFVTRPIPTLYSVKITFCEKSSTSRSVPVSARKTDGGWIGRAVICPASWADADSITVESLTYAGIPLSNDCLPATLRVGYNHDPADAGAVLAAAKLGDVPALQAALDDGGSTEEADRDGCTAFMLAASHGSLEAMRARLAAGAKPAPPDDFGYTPLHAVALSGHAPAVALLLSTPGVDPLVVNKFGKTPLDLAQDYERVAAAALLLADPRVAAVPAAVKGRRAKGPRPWPCD